MKIKRQLYIAFSSVISIICSYSCGVVIDKDVKTTFQTSIEWRPTVDNRADAVMIYGVGGNPSDKSSKKISVEERIASWKKKGYETHFMTGIAWGEYQDYFTGEWDGEWHLDEGQVTAKGDTIWHGHLVPYIVPTENYLNYIKEKHVKRVIDAGITEIFMEEPEFWARGGYSESFKKEWESFYGFPWRAQHESPENTYLSNKLKYHLYYRALNEVFSFAKEYGKSKGLDIKCYVPTHSLVNYSQWQIVSPEASLASLPCVDGYIAQVWTGTSREPNFYNGIQRERVFETAFLEYGSMESMTAPTGRKMFFLTDPIEDRAKDWDDYKRNYQATFVAQLLYPKIANYEIMPWPERIYEGLYKISPNSKEKARIPQDYATQMQVMINSLNKIPQSSSKVSGSNGVSVLMANSLMFQRFPTHNGYNDPQLSNFYGLALPFLKRGIPISTTHIENLKYKECLSDVKILMMTYSNMKPLEKEAHTYLSEWVKKGGILVYSGRDNDPFQAVSEWWNKDGYNYSSPSSHLFSLMNMPHMPIDGIYTYGKGTICIIRQDPKEYVLEPSGDESIVKLVSDLYKTATNGKSLEFKNNFQLSRGIYELIAVMNESVSDNPVEVSGTLVDLFDPQLPVYKSKTICPGEQCFFANIDKMKLRKQPKVIASASREYEEEYKKGEYSYVAKGPSGIKAVARVYLPSEPIRVMIDNKEISVENYEWDNNSNTCLIKYWNSPDGIKIKYILK